MTASGGDQEVLAYNSRREVPPPPTPSSCIPSGPGLAIIGRRWVTLGLLVQMCEPGVCLGTRAQVQVWVSALGRGSLRLQDVCVSSAACFCACVSARVSVCFRVCVTSVLCGSVPV